MHGKVPVSSIVAMKRLSAKAWTLLFSKVCFVKVLAYPEGGTLCHTISVFVEFYLLTLNWTCVVFLHFL